MTYITGMCLRTSFNLLRGREVCWLYGVYEIDFNRICVKVFRFISYIRMLGSFFFFFFFGGGGGVQNAMLTKNISQI